MKEKQTGDKFRKRFGEDRLVQMQVPLGDVKIECRTFKQVLFYNTKKLHSQIWKLKKI